MRSCIRKNLYRNRTTKKNGTAVGGVIAFVAGARPTKDLAHVAAPVGISVSMPRPRRLRDGACKIAFSAFGKGLPNKKNDFGLFRLRFVTFSKDILLDVFLAAKMWSFFPAYLRCFFMSRTGDFFGHDQNGHLRNASSGAVRPKSPVSPSGNIRFDLEKVCFNEVKRHINAWPLSGDLLC